MVAIQDQLLAAVGDRRGVGAADRLCEACVVLFGVDAATFRWFSMGPTPARWGPAGCRHGCMTSCSSSWVGGRAWTRWPTARRCWWSIWPIPMLFGGRRIGRAMLAHQIRGVYAMPVVVAGEFVGALDLFRADPGLLHPSPLRSRLSTADLAGRTYKSPIRVRPP